MGGAGRQNQLRPHGQHGQPTGTSGAGAPVTRRRLAAGGAALGAALAGAACAAPGGEPAPVAPGAVAGKVLFWPSPITDLSRPFWQLIQAGFKGAWPNVELTLDDSVLGPGQSRDDKLLGGLASGSAWDVWQRDIPPSYQQVLVDKNAVLSMDEAYASMPNLKRVFPWARTRSKLSGKTWGVPHGVEFGPIWFNKNVFDRVGVKEAPKTWDQFLALQRTLKSAGVLPMNIAAARSQPGHYYSIFLMGLIGKDGLEDLLWRDKRWDGHDGVIRAAQTLVDFERQGWIPADNRTTAYDVMGDFVTGKQAMWGSVGGGGSAFEAARRANPAFDYDFFIPPAQDAKLKPTAAGGLGNGFSVWAQTKSTAAAIALLDYLMSPEAQKGWIEQLFQVAPVPFKPEDYRVPDVFRKWLGTVVGGQEMGYNVSVVVPAKFVDVYWDGLADILNEKLTPRQWSADLQQQWDVAKKEGRVPKP